ncbi:MAG: radical SAM protein [Deltaproteobacteria bacterium]|nr:radical SAM protein [Deltaproteobacteria bacterium]
MPSFSVSLVQLPVPRAAALSPSGNVPLAIACLQTAVAVHGVPDVTTHLLPATLVDGAGDHALAEAVIDQKPDVLGLSLYLWNIERSLHLARAVKERSPSITVVVGGPEVSADNPLVKGATEIDYAIAGEGEVAFATLLRALGDGREAAAIPGVAAKTGHGLGEFAPPGADVPFDRYPSPYLSGALSVSPGRSCHLESTRGCKARCSFCFYPRRSRRLRVVSVDDTLRTLARLRQAGATDVAFLDPTFNQRPDFEALLDGLAEINHDHALTLFAEIRAEGMTPRHAKKLARAGFARLELGLQSVSAATRRLSRCGGDPDRIAAVANELQDAGITAVVDLIVGLPGDHAADIERGTEFLRAHGLAADAQVFLLAVLPGTTLRTDAARLGLEFDPRPPYRVRRTATLTADELERAWGDAETRLGRPLDEALRPYLADTPAYDHGIDRFEVDLDRGTEDLTPLDRAGSAHQAIVVTGTDLWRDRARFDQIRARRQAFDPFAVVDLVLSPKRPFPLDLLDVLDGVAGRWSMNGYAAHRQGPGGANGQCRVVVQLGRDLGFDDDWLQALGERLPVYLDQSAARAAENASRLGRDLPAARIVDRALAADDPAWRTLATTADPEAVTFAALTLERRFTAEALSYAEPERRRRLAPRNETG